MKRPTPKRNPDWTRERIVTASSRAFSEYGLAGARTDAIAKAAGVNKAMLYYYFKSKEDLYAAALESVAEKVHENTMKVLQRDCSEGECLLRVALNHFDRILTQREFQSLMQQEMVRLRSGQSGLTILVDNLFRPFMRELEKIVRSGMRKGELCEMDWLQVVYATLGANVFYFLSAPLMQIMGPFDPFTRSSLKRRREAAMRFLGSALFRDRRRGALLAQRVLDDTPMPTIKKMPPWRTA